MGLIQAEDEKEILEARDFNKAQTNCKPSNNISPFMNCAYKSMHKQNVATLSETNAPNRVSTDTAVYGTDFIMYF